MTKINNEFPTTSYNDILSKHYFLKVAKEIIEISNLENEKTILDYGCGEKIFSKLLFKPKIFNYDIKPEYNEVSNVKDCFKSDIIIFNHVWMYISQNEIERILSDINSKFKNISYINSDNILSELCEKYGSDKGFINLDTRKPYNWIPNSYTSYYHSIFNLNTN